MTPLVRILVLLVLASSLVGCQQSGADTSTRADSASATPSPSAASASPAASPSGTPTSDDRSGPPLALFFGDSYFVGGGYTGAANSMANVAARRLGWKPVIRGAGGTGFVSGNPGYGIPNFIGQIREGALDVDAVGGLDWLVIEGGGNDKYDRPALIERRALRVLKAAARRHPDARLVLVGTLDPTVDEFSDTDAVIGALSRAAARAGVPYISSQRWLEGRPGLVGPDFDHPLPGGHRVLGRKLARALAAL